MAQRVPPTHADRPRAGFHGFVGVRFMQQAIDLFHERHPDTQLQIAVSRQPYSWAGDNRDEDLQGRFTQFAKGGFQQERAARGNEDAEFIPLDVLGGQAGVKYKHGVEMVWQPVDSQRILLWAARFGKQEEIADEIGKLHFEEVESNADRETLLKAVAAVGLDVAAAEAFLDTDEMVDRIWWSYGATINYYGIKEIPCFVLNRHNSPGPFSGFYRPTDPAPYILYGATPAEDVMDALELIREEWEATDGQAAKL